MAFNRIQEYIDTGYGTAGTLLIPKLIMPTLIAAVEKTLLPRELATIVLGPTQIQGSSFSVNLESPDTIQVQNVSEGAEVPMDNIDFTTILYTPLKYGVAIRITREMMEDSQFELLNKNIQAAGIKFAENETALVLTALDGANTTVTGGASITIANITAAMLAVENQDYVPTDIIIGMEALSDLRNIDTFVEADKAGNTNLMQRNFIGVIYGATVAKFSTNAAPTTTYAKYAYVFDRSHAYGIAIKRDLTVENFDMPTYDMQGAVLTQRIDVKVHRSKAIAKITTT
jgi:HK97 family phage major capsid protein